MAFNGTEGTPIDENIAGDWTGNFRNSPTTTAGNEGHFFGRKILEQLLAQKGAMGIRLYYGLDSKGERQLIAVAADANQDDQLEGDFIVADDSCPCPPWTSSANVLNS